MIIECKKIHKNHLNLNDKRKQTIQKFWFVRSIGFSSSKTIFSKKLYSRSIVYKI